MNTINIQIDIPNDDLVNITELQQKVTAYAKLLVKRSIDASKCRSSLSSLIGICKTDKSDKELVDEYLQEKYGALLS